MITNYIIETIKKIKKNKPLIIAFDGVDTSGKTTLANLVFETMLKKKVFSPLRVQIDKFHNPKNIRIRKGELSPEGFFYDSFDYDTILKNVINPIKKGLDNIITESYDYRVEDAIKKNKITITNDTVILFDGIFMNRDELFDSWDLSIFLDVTFDTVLKRALERDIEFLGSKDIVEKKYLNRYIPGEKIYLSKCKPMERANIVIDNNDYLNPRLVKKFDN